MKQIKKAVIPVAGLGTRFLPATKVVPKELLPIVDKPALQYVVEEAVASGLSEIIFISNPQKQIIEDHFNSNSVHDELLHKMGKSVLLKELNELNEKITITTVVQKEQLGLGHAVLCAEQAVGDEWFVVLLPDMLIDSTPSCTASMLKIWEEKKCSIIAAGHAPKEMISQYGIIAPDGAVTNRVCKIKELVEKPKLEDAPSDLFIAGRYLLSPQIFKYLHETKPGKIGEIQITDALQSLAKKDGMYAYDFEGVLHDTGNKLEYLKANLYYAMKDENYKTAITDYAKYLERK